MKLGRRAEAAAAFERLLTRTGFWQLLPASAVAQVGLARAHVLTGPLSESKPHPRAWGTFPRILGKYVREEKLLTLEDAVRKMTSRPAIRVGLTDRGLLRPGMAADVMIFDAETVRDVATFEDPNHYSQGIVHVLVNGKAVVRDGKITDERPGQVLRGPGYR